MSEIPNIRNQVKIDLTEYGYTGELVLEELSAKRHYELQNRVGECIVQNKDGSTYKKIGDITIYTFLAYIVKAPFMGTKELTKDQWMWFFDKLPYDKAMELTARLDTEINNFGLGRAERARKSPLAQSGVETSNSASPDT